MGCKKNTERGTAVAIQFGARLSAIMKEKKVSNNQMYYLTGVDRGDMSRIRNGKRQISLMTIAKLAEGLEVPVTDLFQG